MADNSKKLTEAMIATWAKTSEQNGTMKTNRFYGKPLPQQLGSQAQFASATAAFSSMAVVNTHYKSKAK